MITKETRDKMAELVAEYDNGFGAIHDKPEPYLIEHRVDTERSYNKSYGDDKECECGHPYHRHFDSYERMYPIGCKYCQCDTFTEKSS